MRPQPHIEPVELTMGALAVLAILANIAMMIAHALGSV